MEEGVWSEDVLVSVMQLFKNVGISEPLSYIWVYLCKYTYKLAEKTWLFTNVSLEKDSMLFIPFRREKKGSSEIPDFYQGVPLLTGSEASLTNENL